MTRQATILLVGALFLSALVVSGVRGGSLRKKRSPSFDVDDEGPPASFYLSPFGGSNWFTTFLENTAQENTDGSAGKALSGDEKFEAVPIPVTTPPPPADSSEANDGPVDGISSTSDDDADEEQERGKRNIAYPGPNNRNRYTYNSNTYFAGGNNANGNNNNRNFAQYNRQQYNYNYPGGAAGNARLSPYQMMRNRFQQQQQQPQQQQYSNQQQRNPPPVRATSQYPSQYQQYSYSGSAQAFWHPLYSAYNRFASAMFNPYAARYSNPRFAPYYLSQQQQQQQQGRPQGSRYRTKEEGEESPSEPQRVRIPNRGGSVSASASSGSKPVAAEGVKYPNRS